MPSSRSAAAVSPMRAERHHRVHGNVQHGIVDRSPERLGARGIADGPEPVDRHGAKSRVIGPAGFSQRGNRGAAPDGAERPGRIDPHRLVRIGERRGERRNRRLLGKGPEGEGEVLAHPGIGRRRRFLEGPHQVGSEGAEFRGVTVLDAVREFERRLPLFPVSPGPDPLELFLGGRVVGNEPREPQEDPPPRGSPPAWGSRRTAAGSARTKRRPLRAAAETARSWDGSDHPSL